MPNIRHSLIIGASAQKVYSAITTKEGLSAWWTPETAAEAQIGSVARFAFGPTYFKEMKVTGLIPSNQVEWTCIAGAEEWIGTSLTFKLESGEKKILLRSHPEMGDQIEQHNMKDVTLLTLHHDNWREYSPMYAECSYTWAQFLKSLKLFCETGKGTPWPNQHRIL